MRDHSNVVIEWHARSLEKFEEQPIEVLAREYDLIALDHPFVGGIVDKNVLVPLDELLPTSYLEDQETNSVGRSHRSYQWAGHQWAVAIDAASQVSAFRADILADIQRPIPRSWDDVYELLGALPPKYKIGIPLAPTHLLGLFLSLCVDRLGPALADDEHGLIEWLRNDLATSSVAAAVVDQIYGLTDRLHPASLNSNPIGILNVMSLGDEIAYSPVIFGYCTYSRVLPGRHQVRFADIPSSGPEPRGAMLGGVGMAISKTCRSVQVAADYLQAIASGPWQRKIYYEAGGQPGHRTAWTDPRINADAGDFFQATLPTVDRAFVRPRVANFPSFQRLAGRALHSSLVERMPPAKTLMRLAETWHQCIDGADHAIARRTDRP